MESTGFFMAALAVAHSWLARARDHREDIRNRKKPVRSNKNTFHALIGLWERIKEKQARIQNDGCIEKHSEVGIFLRSADNTAQELGRLAMEIISNRCWEKSRQGTAGESNSHPILEWVLPAAEMLEGAFDRLWLHVHLVNIKCTAQNPPSSSVVDTGGGMEIDQEEPETLSDWIALCCVPVVRGTSQQRLSDIVDYVSSHKHWPRSQALSTHGERNGSGNDTYVLVVERGCVGLENVDSSSGATEAKLANSLLSGLWGFNLKSPDRLRDRSIRTGSLFDLSSNIQNPEQSLPVGAETREDVCLCFSDLLEPANSRPMFGHLLRMHPTTSWLHSARIQSLSRIDEILELPLTKRERSKTPGLGSLGTVQEMIDCSAWLIDQSPGIPKCESFAELPEMSFHSDTEIHSPQHDNDWESFWTRQFPENGAGRHFAIRAAYCVFASVRPLTRAELLAATTTKLDPDDYDWAQALSGSTRRVESLLDLWSPFLTTMKNGRVKIKSASLARHFLQNELNTAVEAEIFLAHVCLSHLGKMGLRMVIWPWSGYNELRTRAEHHPLHAYVSSYWQHHYQRAEPHSINLPKLLHRMIESAWLAERTQVSSENDTEDEVDLDAYDEALDVGLVLCQAFEFKELASAYLTMGARIPGSPVISLVSTTDNNPFATDASTQPIGHNVKIKPDHSVGAGHLCQSSRVESFDFSDWYHVEPFNPP